MYMYMYFDHIPDGSWRECVCLPVPWCYCKVARHSHLKLI